MRKFKCVLIVAAIALSANFSTAQSLKKGSVLLEGYYGFPNLFKRFLFSQTIFGNEIDIKSGSKGPYGARFEYMVSNNLGLGLDVGFRSSFASFNRIDTANNIYNYDFITSKFGIMLTLNYHVNNLPDNMDLAIGFGLGYGNRILEFTSTDPNFNFSFDPIFPLSMRAGINYRYFFNNYLGVNAGLGIGQGGIINLGVSFKIPH